MSIGIKVIRLSYVKCDTLIFHCNTTGLCKVSDLKTLQGLKFLLYVDTHIYI